MGDLILLVLVVVALLAGALRRRSQQQVGVRWGMRCGVCGKTMRRGDPGAPVTLGWCGPHHVGEVSRARRVTV